MSTTEHYNEDAYDAVGDVSGVPVYTWDKMFPDGRYVFYEGDDPDGFVEEMKSEFGFDPTVYVPNEMFPPSCEWGKTWTAQDGEEMPPWVGFFIPPGLVEAVYGNRRRWRLGS